MCIYAYLSLPLTLSLSLRVCVYLSVYVCLCMQKSEDGVRLFRAGVTDVCGTLDFLFNWDLNFSPQHRAASSLYSCVISSAAELVSSV